MTNSSNPVPYATSDLNTRRGRGEDPAVNFFGGLQIILAVLVAVPELLTLLFNFDPSRAALELSMGSQPLFYLLLSGLVFAASRPRLIAWRVIAYRIYAVGFFAVDANALIGIGIDDLRGNPIERAIYLAYPIATLFANPVLVILLFRRVQQFLRPLPDAPPARGFEVITNCPQATDPPVDL